MIRVIFLAAMTGGNRRTWPLLLPASPFGSNIWDFELTAGEMKQIGGMDKRKELFVEHDSPEMAQMFGNYRI